MATDKTLHMTTEMVRSPALMTCYVSQQLMMQAQTVISRDQMHVEALHEIHVDKPDRLGMYRLCLMVSGRDEAIRESHIFDLQMMLDMRDTWHEHVEKKVLNMISNIAMQRDAQ